MSSSWSKTKDDVSYFWEMVKHRYNTNSLFGSLAAGALLSIPFGFGVGFIPLLGYAAGLTIASVFIPSSKWFRENVDARIRHEQREIARTHLIEELEARIPNAPMWGVYANLLQRRDALARVAGERETALSMDDVERLDDATVDFLGLWLSRLAMESRYQTMSEDQITMKIAEVERQIAEDPRGPSSRRLARTKSNLEMLLKKRKELVTRDMETETKMMAIADSLDEVYQRVMANPTSQEDVHKHLHQAVEQMNLEEEYEDYLDAEFDELLAEAEKEASVAH